MESFDIFRATESGKPISVGYSAAPFNNYSQDISARVYLLNSDINLPYQIDTFKLSDVSKVSQESDLEFVKSHSYPSAFSLPDLSPSSYSDFVEDIKEDEDLAVEFIHKSAMNNPSTNKDSCNEICRK